MACNGVCSPGLWIGASCRPCSSRSVSPSSSRTCSFRPSRRTFRATADDQETVRLMGIDNRHTYGLAVAIAFGIVAVAGVFLGIRTTFSPDIGPGRLLVAFETVVIGGLGSLWGTLVGGVILGTAHTLGAKVDPAYRELAGHLVFLLVLLVRPQGL